MCTVLMTMLFMFWCRQELNRRGAFDFKEDDEINFRTLLQRLMVELVKDEELAAQQRGEEKREQTLSAVDEAKRLRDQKKQEALERSRQRQANPEYFKQKAERNQAPAVAEIVPAENVEEGEEEDKGESQEDDPFRSYKPKGRSKIFVK